MKKTLIWIVIDTTDGEPIISSSKEELALKELDDWNGLDSGQSKLIEDREIIYNGEYQGNLMRVRTYEDELNGKVCKTVFELWCIECIQE